MMNIPTFWHIMLEHRAIGDLDLLGQAPLVAVKMLAHALHVSTGGLMSAETGMLCLDAHQLKRQLPDIATSVGITLRAACHAHETHQSMFCTLCWNTGL